MNRYIFEAQIFEVVWLEGFVERIQEFHVLCSDAFYLFYFIIFNILIFNFNIILYNITLYSIFAIWVSIQINYNVSFIYIYGLDKFIYVKCLMNKIG